MFTLVLCFTSAVGVKEYLLENYVEISADRTNIYEYIVVCYCYEETAEKLISELEGSVRFKWHILTTDSF